MYDGEGGNMKDRGDRRSLTVQEWIEGEDIVFMLDCFSLFQLCISSLISYT